MDRKVVVLAAVLAGALCLSFGGCKKESAPSGQQTGAGAATPSHEPMDMLAPKQVEANKIRFASATPAPTPQATAAPAKTPEPAPGDTYKPSFANPASAPAK